MTCTITSNGKERQWKCKNEYEPPYAAIKILLLQKIQQLFDTGYTDFYVNCEYGIPLWTAEAICLLKQSEDINLHIGIPHEEQCRNWSEDLRNRYYNVHAMADSIVFSSRKFNKYCYERADELMTEKSDFVLIFGNASDNLFITAYAAETQTPISFLEC